MLFLLTILSCTQNNIRKPNVNVSDVDIPADIPNEQESNSSSSVSETIETVKTRKLEDQADDLDESNSGDEKEMLSGLFKLDELSRLLNIDPEDQKLLVQLEENYMQREHSYVTTADAVAEDSSQSFGYQIIEDQEGVYLVPVIYNAEYQSPAAYMTSNIDKQDITYLGSDIGNDIGKGENKTDSYTGPIYSALSKEPIIYGVKDVSEQEEEEFNSRMSFYPGMNSFGKGTVTLRNIKNVIAGGIKGIKQIGLQIAKKNGKKPKVDRQNLREMVENMKVLTDTAEGGIHQ